ncbi:unnamed protein product, partial [Didymodactylos carnosus]
MAATSQSSKFLPPTNKQQLKALGGIYKLNGDIRRAITVGIDESFLPIPIPKGGDWLDVHEETGQTVGEYVKMSKTIPTSTHELFCIGVTMADLYPQADWNFVYGEADIDRGIGLWSFARLDPLFPLTEEQQWQIPTEEQRILILKRAIGVFLHELIHLFGMEHCIYYLCMMNGTEHEEEMDEQPLYLCPVCLRKLYSSLEKVDFDVIRMYQGILDVCKKFNFKEEAE